MNEWRKPLPHTFKLLLILAAAYFVTWLFFNQLVLAPSKPEEVDRGAPATKTHCAKGHELTADNLVPWQMRVKGWRSCKKCGDAAKAKYRGRQKAIAA